ncbi:pentatricopeptide repeat-containing protein At4g39530 [Selaginella moellendorffii]|uniref:pentatricopeptide repeat-containing protein At4g39530 n=1 Tax=Selaginella moellendorffii TaxID=88036 RepID=UPI000D1C9365|nr:pentatricopeptide repeat-containing protein At4g39530 [Selaginella moellendorffii]|eukprot:XP_024520483.1 pentatricopeptide repeat-containing protein At4g39530 [Selaginella moellendorffii]
MYAKCGAMASAHAIFQAMRSHDVVSWTALILGYADNGRGHVALDLFSAMRRSGCDPNARTFVAVILACSSMAAVDRPMAIEKGRWIHEQAAQHGFDTDRFVGNTLVDMYAKFGSMADAAKAFDRMPQRDVVAWTSLMLGYAAAGEGELVLELFSRIRSQGCAPDRLCFTAALTACSIVAGKETGKRIPVPEAHPAMVVKLESLRKVMEIHSQAATSGKNFDVCLSNTLVDAYSKSGSLLDARRVFDRMPRHDVVSFTALMLGAVEGDRAETALELLGSMRARGCEPNARTFVAGLMACTNLAAKEEARLEILPDGTRMAFKLASLERGMELHSQAAKERYDVTDMFVGNTLVDFYSKCGSLQDATKAFDRMAEHDLVSWNALIAGHLDNGLDERALQLFLEMDRRGCSPDPASYTSALAACAGLASLGAARDIHWRLCKAGLETDAFVHNALVDFYGKSGRMADAELVFQSLASVDVVTWNALAAGLSRQGSYRLVVDLLWAIKDQGLEPDGITFLALLAAYGHAGLVDHGRRAFAAMVETYRIEPGIEHYHCLVDMLGRANRLEEAVAVVSAMPHRPSSVTWTTVLSACVKWKNLGVASVAFESLLGIDPDGPAAYVLMANVYGSAGMAEEEAKLLEHVRR